MQNHILNSAVLLDQCQSSLRTQASYLVTVVAAQQNTQVNELGEDQFQMGRLSSHLYAIFPGNSCIN